MAKPAAAVRPTSPVAAPPLDTLRRIHVKRHGNDDYTVSETTLATTDGETWRPVGVRILKPHCGVNVARDYVSEWHRNFCGPNFFGETGL